MAVHGLAGALRVTVAYRIEEIGVRAPQVVRGLLAEQQSCGQEELHAHALHRLLEVPAVGGSGNGVVEDDVPSQRCSRLKEKLMGESTHAGPLARVVAASIPPASS
jgi:hypothetical protein